MITLGKWIPELAPIPRGYGIAWLTGHAFGAYCLPIPLNVIAGLGHSLWLRLKFPFTSDPLIAAYGKGYADGQQSGEAYGYEKGIRHATILLEETRQLSAEMRAQLNIRG